MLVYLEQQLVFVHKLCATVPQYQVYESQLNFSRYVTVEGRADMIQMSSERDKNCVLVTGTFYD
jgi:hypothetical protein